MISLLVFKERLKAFYSRYDMYVIPCIKFVFSFLAFFMLNKNVGYMSMLTNPAIPLVLALVCSFLPYGAITVLAGAFMLAHLSSVSFELALIMTLGVLIVVILYYGFHPGDSYLLILTPLLFLFKIPYAVPLLTGLSGSLLSVIPVSCGVFVYYTLLYVKQNAGVLTNDTSVALTQKYVQVIKNLTSNKLTLVMVAAFAISVIVVFIIKNLSIDYAWVIAIIAGMIAQLVVIFIGDVTSEISIPVIELLFSVAASALVAGIYTFFEFAVDYSRTEYVQFEDDDYYYYVKAVPKLVVSAPDVKVQKINVRRPQKNSRQN